jgi:hypothetical protein
MNRPDRVRARRSPRLAAAAAVVALGAGCADDPPTHGDHGRQADVAQRGASVMPFDLDRTTHHFSKTDSGGVQTVVADDPRDAAQIALIRQHLREEVERFRRGDFTDPGRIHGDRMPGLDALRGHGGRITIDFASTPDGGRITYVTADPGLVAALHAWFDAQVSDHGTHASG